MHSQPTDTDRTQQCSGLPRPVQQGEVAWHFILPQAVQFDPSPTNVFDTLSVTFQGAGTIFLSALTDFGPPSNAHAYVVTPTDDTLLGGTATIGRDLNAARGNDPQFNLSHTCASQVPPPTTTTTSTTSSSSTAPTATPTASSTSTTAAVGPATSSQATAAPTSASNIPVTGSDSSSATNAALFALAVGFALVVVARLRTTREQ